MHRNYVCIDATVSPELSSSVYVIFSRKEDRMRQMLIVWKEANFTTAFF